MKTGFIVAVIMLFVFYPRTGIAQEIPATVQQLEDRLSPDEETEDDSWFTEMEHFRKHPLNINTADASELRQLRIISDLQINNLVIYRRLFGKLISIYELQAVPAWDISTIKKLLPFITINDAGVSRDELAKRFRYGEHSLLMRYSQVLEKAKGFGWSDSSGHYLGGPQKILFRYRYTYKNLLQWGLLGDKDAGEPFFRKGRQPLFDFYSFHLFARKLGIIHSMAIGDFIINMGQGLIQWQGLAFKKGPEVSAVKRQSPVLRPYGSAGEFYFNRGAGITLVKGRFESTLFASVRKLSANIVMDTISGDDYFSSFRNSGYHRTINEMTARNRLKQTSAGINLSLNTRRFHLGVNGVYYHFSAPLQKRNEPYNLYAIQGSNWYNTSIDYSYTYRNIHFFGEAATDKHFSRAMVNGILISADPRIDIAILHRSISAAYQTVYGNAFTENTNPSNEQGLYAGISIRPVPGWKLDFYGDIFRFPWLKYQVNAPSFGNGFLFQATYKPDKQTELVTRIKTENKQLNAGFTDTVMHSLAFNSRLNWRTQFLYKPGSDFTIRGRVEMVWYREKRSSKEAGFLLFADLLYKPPARPVSAGMRWQYFETDSYDSRIYVYENDVLYAYSIPAFFGKGFRWYFNLNYDPGRRTSIWLRLARLIQPETRALGSGSEEIKGNHRTEIRFQLRWIF